VAVESEQGLGDGRQLLQIPSDDVAVRGDQQRRQIDQKTGLWLPEHGIFSPQDTSSLWSVLLAGCSTNEQERVGTDTGRASQISSEEDDKTDKPVQVSGSYLWLCDFAEDVGQDATDIIIGYNLLDGTVQVNISKLESKAVLVDATGASKAQMVAGAAGATWHFTATVKQADLKDWKAKLDVKDSKCNAGSYSAPLAPLAGALVGVELPGFRRAFLYAA
jgi:hypothetical protein